MKSRCGPSERSTSGSGEKHRYERAKKLYEQIVVVEGQQDTGLLVRAPVRTRLRVVSPCEIRGVRDL